MEKIYIGQKPYVHIMFKLTVIILCLLPVIAQANKNMLHPSGLSIPRFVSLKSNEINVRVGPGTRYPIAWVFNKKGYPVEIIEEFGHWRKIRDHQASKGWIHKNLLSGRRMAMMKHDMQSLYIQADSSAPIVMKAEKGVLSNIIACNKNWCLLGIGDHEGWAQKTQLWGIYNKEIIED